jgi:hypothetical protein
MDTSTKTKEKIRRFIVSTSLPDVFEIIIDSGSQGTGPQRSALSR